MIELPPAMTRNTKVLLVMDVVESVRIMEQDQDGFVRRWQQLVEHAEQQVLPLHGGRIVAMQHSLLNEKPAARRFWQGRNCWRGCNTLQYVSARTGPKVPVAGSPSFHGDDLALHSPRL